MTTGEGWSDHDKVQDTVCRSEQSKLLLKHLSCMPYQALFLRIKDFGEPGL